MKWEYQQGRGLSNLELNDLGAEGWELVSVIHAYYMYYYFKRPVED